VAITLYVGNLSWSLTEEELAEIFAEAGHVEQARIVVDRETGRSRGFGFVQLAESNALEIIARMNGRLVRGRKLVVDQPRAPSQAREASPGEGSS
jgi:RNA recognition motif-containing protein